MTQKVGRMPTACPFRSLSLNENFFGPPGQACDGQLSGLLPRLTSATPRPLPRLPNNHHIAASAAGAEAELRGIDKNHCSFLWLRSGLRLGGQKRYLQSRR
jgi:hypothetical protein